MNEASPARLYLTVAGTLLVVLGVGGFFYNGQFGSGGDLFGNDSSVKVLGAFAVNGWANVVHLVTGAIALLAVGYAARACSLAIGVFYVVAAIWGFAAGSGDAVLSAIPVNTADNVLHLLVGMLGLAAAVASGRAGAEPVTAG